MLIYATIKLRTYILTAMDHVSVGVAVGGLDIHASQVIVKYRIKISIIIQCKRK